MLMFRLFVQLAAANGHVDSCKLLLDLGANILNVDESGYTGIHWAIASGDDDTVSFFLKRADGRRSELNSVTGVGLLQVAAAAGHWSAAQWLLSRGDDVNSVDARHARVDCSCGVCLFILC
jgi:ankyrin repeat protein